MIQLISIFIVAAWLVVGAAFHGSSGQDADSWSSYDRVFRPYSLRTRLLGFAWAALTLPFIVALAYVGGVS